LHALQVNSCPFDQTFATCLNDARERTSRGAVDESDFDDEHFGATAADLLEKLIKDKPKSEDLVVTHGDACLPNIFVDGESFSDFVDCGRLGVADRYRDLALAGRSISSNLGYQWVEPFFRRYGLFPPNSSKLAFYRLLDEFF